MCASTGCASVVIATTTARMARARFTSGGPSPESAHDLAHPIPQCHPGRGKNDCHVAGHRHPAVKGSAGRVKMHELIGIVEDVRAIEVSEIGHPEYAVASDRRHHEICEWPLYRDEHGEV